MSYSARKITVLTTLLAVLSVTAHAQTPVTVKAIFPGEAPRDWNTVLTAVNKKLQADRVGVALEIQWIPWSDYGDQTRLKMAAGENFDAFLDAPWLHIQSMIDDQAIIPLDALVAKAPALRASIPQAMWEANKFGGKIYGIPHGVAQGPGLGFAVRRDLREKYKLPPIKSLADLERYLYAVKRNEKGVTPLCVSKEDAANLQAWLSPVTWDRQPGTVSVVGPYTLANENRATPRVQAFWDGPGYEEALRRTRKYVVDGIINKDAVSIDRAVKTPRFTSGSCGAVPAFLDGQISQNFSAVRENVKGGALEAVFPYKSGQLRNLSDFRQYNFLVVTRQSKHPQKVIDLSNWLSVKANHDLLQYGIEGTHWKAVGADGRQNLGDVTYDFPGYVISWRPGLDRTLVSMDPTEKRWYAQAKDARNFTKSIYAGYQFDPGAVKNELSQLSATETETLIPLQLGLVDPDQGLARVKAAFNRVGYQKVLGEVQRQVNTFLRKGTR